MTDSDQAVTVRSTIGSLRRSLALLSHTRNGETLSQALAGQSVICLANLQSLRARYVSRCDFTRQDYMELTGVNDRFLSLLTMITSSEMLPVEFSLFEKFPLTETQWGEPGRRTLSASIEKALEKYTVAARPMDAYRVAVLELIGQKIEWREKDILPAPLVPARPSGRFYKTSLAESVAVVRDLDWRQALLELGQFYSSDGPPIGAADRQARVDAPGPQLRTQRVAARK
ncbi:MAG: hypothetical protein HYR60_33875 [Acidobacteria bacterium]|nr:hypothetical protein [Acidobacteriota bacterium]